MKNAVYDSAYIERVLSNQKPKVIRLYLSVGLFLFPGVL